MNLDSIREYFKEELDDKSDYDYILDRVAVKYYNKLYSELTDDEKRDVENHTDEMKYKRSE